MRVQYWDKRSSSDGMPRGLRSSPAKPGEEAEVCYPCEIWWEGWGTEESIHVHFKGRWCVEGRIGTLQGRVVCGGEARYPSRQGGVWRGG